MRSGTSRRPRDAQLAERLGIGREDPVVGYVSSLNSYEGIRYLVEAAARLRDQVPNLRVLVVGEGPDGDAIRETAHRLGLDGSTLIMPGRVPHDAIVDYYSLIDVFVVPRTSQRVSQLVTPLKPYEAMALERAVVVQRPACPARDRHPRGDRADIPARGCPGLGRSAGHAAAMIRCGVLDLAARRGSGCLPSGHGHRMVAVIGTCSSASGLPRRRREARCRRPSPGLPRLAPSSPAIGDEQHPRGPGPSVVSIGWHQSSVDVTSVPPGRRRRRASLRYAPGSTPCSITESQAIASNERIAYVVRVKSIGSRRIAPDATALCR